MMRTEKEYDERGRVVKEIYYESDGIAGWIDFGYDADGNKTDKRYYDVDGNVVCYSKTVFDSDDWVIKQTYYLPDGRVLYWEDFEIDEDKMTVTVTRHNPDGSVECEEYKYDEDGNVS